MKLTESLQPSILLERCVAVYEAQSDKLRDVMTRMADGSFTGSCTYLTTSDGINFEARVLSVSGSSVTLNDESLDLSDPSVNPEALTTAEYLLYAVVPQLKDLLTSNESMVALSKQIKQGNFSISDFKATVEEACGYQSEVAVQNAITILTSPDPMSAFKDLIVTSVTTLSNEDIMGADEMTFTLADSATPVVSAVGATIVTVASTAASIIGTALMVIAPIVGVALTVGGMLANAASEGVKKMNEAMALTVPAIDTNNPAGIFGSAILGRKDSTFGFFRREASRPFAMAGPGFYAYGLRFTASDGSSNRLAGDFNVFPMLNITSDIQRLKEFFSIGSALTWNDVAGKWELNVSHPDVTVFNVNDPTSYARMKSKYEAVLDKVDLDSLDPSDEDSQREIIIRSVTAAMVAVSTLYQWFNAKTYGSTGRWPHYTDNVIQQGFTWFANGGLETISWADLQEWFKELFDLLSADGDYDSLSSPGYISMLSLIEYDDIGDYPTDMSLDTDALDVFNGNQVTTCGVLALRYPLYIPSTNADIYAPKYKKWTILATTVIGTAVAAAAVIGFAKLRIKWKEFGLKRYKKLKTDYDLYNGVVELEAKTNTLSKETVREFRKITRRFNLEAFIFGFPKFNAYSGLPVPTIAIDSNESQPDNNVERLCTEILEYTRNVIRGD